ncbi:P-loop containing nucleoside triphosphate hydrolase protein [Gaertneriomyces semiglobifer]|nr:P-loop containing nucleoside triphosphate hydrolase protein [Gaertneriomyces semiglobifer]
MRTVDDFLSFICIEGTLGLLIGPIQLQIATLQSRRTELQELRKALTSQLDAEPETNVNSVLSNDVLASYSGEFPWTAEVKRIAKAHWGITEFRPNQLEIINAVLSKRDTFVIMPTGGGKSLCFQIPACISRGLTVVVSPLISLSRDQVFCLEEVGIRAAMLAAGTAKEEVKRIHRAMLGPSSHANENNADPDARELKLLYVTPEKIAKSKRFMSQLEKVYKLGRLATFVIDEAHCCSQVGHDFRPDYKSLHILKTLFPATPIIALSATCPPHVIRSVLDNLHMRPIGHPTKGTMLFQSPLHRPNLRYSVRIKPSAAQAVITDIANWISMNHHGECGIIYCLSKKDTQAVADGLVKASGGKIKAAVYHADLDDIDRDEVHTLWRAGEIQVVVATIAFGLGINQPNVRFVVHHTMSKSVEGYYQESGRAGRDGLPSDCVLYHRGQDISRLSAMVVGEVEGLKGVYGMLTYAQDLTTCRRLLMERYFGVSGPNAAQWGPKSSAKCGNCDHCLRGTQSDAVIRVEDVTAQAVDVLKIVRCMSEEQERVTLARVVEIWRGVGKKYPSVEDLKRQGTVTVPPPKMYSKEVPTVILQQHSHV